MTEQDSTRTDRIPIQSVEIEAGECAEFVGSDLKMYARNTGDGYDIAVWAYKASKWEFDHVTYEWSPPGLYNRGKVVDWHDFPNKDDGVNIRG